MDPPRSNSTIYQYTNDMRNPGTPIILALVDLGLNAHWLLTGKGPAHAPGEQGDRIAPNMEYAISEYLKELKD